jgi:GT2 family glycosyltransferase
MKILTIIIPSYNRLEDLKKCIKSIESQTYTDYTTLIIDNGSEDRTIPYLKDKQKKLKENFKVIYNKNNKGASEARNQAMRLVKSKYILFLDSDAELKTNITIQNMIRIMESPKGKTIGQLGGEIINGKIRVGNSERNEDGLFSWYDNLHMRKVDYVPTSNCMMRTEVLKKVGGFDPYYIYGYEDNDVGYQVRKLGLTCIMDENTMAYHHVSNSGRTSSFFRFHRNRVRFLIKKEKFYFLLFLPIIDLYLTLKLAPPRIKEFSQKSADEVAWLSLEKKKKMSKKDSKFKKVFVLGYDSLINMFEAYLWNISHLRQTLKIRFNKPNFIKNENKP